MLLHQHLAPPNQSTSDAIQSLIKVVAELKGEVAALRQAVVSLQGGGVSRAAESSGELGQSAQGQTTSRNKNKGKGCASPKPVEDLELISGNSDLNLLLSNPANDTAIVDAA
ncbi:hypothetical protein E8E12_001270 [Didymella heteroderae]|uniref:Uncharacterized protein n=1 Tax=Didymella heteroderae TaxID=1769908 RepID=A0A9P5C4B1_9PLEO|nr:hypothetical protein E8E12_001270 [Didymella heteroderae]